ncbi:VC0807 family protein [Nocardia sp. NPDC051321]|uniref:VC0807 family protein n=1 Tax=Nocardia sp. NPDC051321 TaxID=3364323 RepID=UPI0037B859E9
MASARLAYVVVRHRRIDGLAVFMIGILLLGLLSAVAVGDVRLLAARDSVTTIFVGGTFLVTTLFRRPVLYLVSRRFRAPDPESRRRWDAVWDTEPGFRRMYMIASATWGTALLAEAIVRIVAVYVLPLDMVVALSSPVQLGLIALLAAWSIGLRRRPGHRQWKYRLDRELPARNRLGVRSADPATRQR